MGLILGGFGAGKRTYAKTLGFSDTEMSNDPHADAPVLFDLEAAVKADPASAEALLPLLLRKKLILCREVGSGVIPMDPKEREWREATGRLCCALAERADAVVRVVCGIPTVLKGELPCTSD